MERRTYLRAVGASAALGLAGCLDSRAMVEDYDVGMSADSFRPETLTVEAGTTVVFGNTSKQGHTVTAYEDTLPDGAAFFASGGYDSEAAALEAWEGSLDGGIPQGGVYEHTFEVPGTYGYYCIPHEPVGMVGSVVVE